MERKVYKKLLDWQKTRKRKPLLLQGARQVGKTYLLKEFGKKEYSKVFYLNFESDKRLDSLFKTSIEPAAIISKLRIFFNEDFDINTTLLIFDEIQSSERALSSLKYFNEDANEYHIAAAGSLLGIVMNRKEYSFPVGQTQMQHVYPMDFEEFLMAVGKSKLIPEIRTCFENDAFCSFHEMALSLFHDYLITGGMPEVVAEFVKNNDHLKAADIQQQILDSYIADMAKYATPEEVSKIIASYNSLPAQLAKENRKFQYKVVQKGGYAGIFGAAIDWLSSAGLVYKCNRITVPNEPLAAYSDMTGFKLYMNDPGLLVQKSGMPLREILLEGKHTSSFIGPIVENYVASSFQSQGIPLYYWESGNTAEIDFLIQGKTGVVPIEVKASTNTRSRSIDVFRKKYNSSIIIRLSEKNFGFDNQIKSIPLYAAFCIDREL
ncbi:MAG: hypothetical protein A2W93_02660 [Bacteroidetes bacterium GWF2_43_63]|nr:MAG: hypothetical protein A2W94_08670 [Bacteroidetes bacterium GWE2_42_42]OFY53571.1 MAG: hypothetical protein A2W93_02660 [Bacteroidetes bacterium GWF2_43_63]HBG71098.1 ATPase [Bacteroidales bacterium]HCB63675.1 ATPase [Bacteroidales bacterium]HCY24424.1 ATPase [Bacteroidales bacterium]